MAEKKRDEMSPDDMEKQLEHGASENEAPDQLSPQKVERRGSLRTVEVGLSADEVIKDTNVDHKERTRILRKVDYRLIPLLGFIYLYVGHLGFPNL